MPKVFHEPGRPLDGATNYLAPLGKSFVWQQAAGFKFSDVADAGFTILLVQADNAHAVPWTKPDDLDIDTRQPTFGLARLIRRVFLLLSAMVAC